MNKHFIISILVVAMVFLMASCGNTEAANTKDADSNAEKAVANTENVEAHKVAYLSTQMFIDQIFDYKANPEKWVYKGDKPAIIDFYATWCGPCKRVAPIMEELAAEYDGQINIYKVDTDKEKELAGQVFGIRSIPSILFIPVDGQPTMYTGAYPKEHYVDLIKENLLKK